MVSDGISRLMQQCVWQQPWVEEARYDRKQAPGDTRLEQEGEKNDLNSRKWYQSLNQGKKEQEV